MPEHYADWWWEELPPKAQQAALAMGYTSKTWDDDKDIAYDSLKVNECSFGQKSAAMYLGMSPIDHKCDIWWSETDDVTKKHAQALGWDQHKWDDDWEITDLPCEHLYWNELSDEQKEAAQFFGYTQPMWDEVDNDAALRDWGSEEEFVVVAGEKEEEKKQDESEDDYSSEEDAAQAKNDNEKPKKKKNQFKLSESFGGDKGEPFKLGNYRHIDKLIIFEDSHVINGIQVIHGGTHTVGNKKGKQHTFDLDKGEFIVHATVRANMFVQSLQFRTNKGRTLGPCGGTGIRGREKPGQEVPVPAPFKKQLCGFQGTSEAHINSIAFVWGPVPGQKKK